MRIPQEGEMIEELVNLKELIKSLDLQMGIGEHTERAIINRINKILRIAKCPTARMKIKFPISDKPSKAKEEGK